MLFACLSVVASFLSGSGAIHQLTRGLRIIGVWVDSPRFLSPLASTSWSLLFGMSQFTAWSGFLELNHEVEGFVTERRGKENRRVR